MTYIKFKFPVKLGKGYQFAKGVGARNIIIHNSGKMAKRKYDNDALTIGYEINPLKIETHYLSKFTQTVNGEDYVLYDDDCYVSKKGIVVDGQGNVRPLQTSVSDSDMGCMRAAVPHVKGENRRSCFLHEMMAEVWLNHDLSDVNNVVYHKNGNICDNDLSNLQIVKRDSKEAKEENENWKKWRDAENIRLSGHI